MAQAAVIQAFQRDLSLEDVHRFLALDLKLRSLQAPIEAVEIHQPAAAQHCVGGERQAIKVVWI